MIKRRFYKQDHGDRNDASPSSSSSSDSDSIDDSDSIEEEEAEQEEPVTEPKVEKKKPKSSSAGSGYESEDSSANEVNCDSSGLIDEDEESTGNGIGHDVEDHLGTGNVRTMEETPNKAAKASNAKDSALELDECVLKCKSVFKCRLCPRIICLSQDTLKAHLNSKRHARSKKLLGEGRLKLMLNSDGEIEEEQETHAERHARTLALAQESANPKKKKNKGRQRQRQRLKKQKLLDGAKGRGVKQLSTSPTKKRRKIED